VAAATAGGLTPSFLDRRCTAGGRLSGAGGGRPPPAARLRGAGAAPGANTTTPLFPSRSLDHASRALPAAATRRAASAAAAASIAARHDGAPPGGWALPVSPYPSTYRRRQWWSTSGPMSRPHRRLVQEAAGLRSSGVEDRATRSRPSLLLSYTWSRPACAPGRPPSPPGVRAPAPPPASRPRQGRWRRRGPPRARPRPRPGRGIPGWPQTWW
jgi:hypothetical protein